MCMPAGAQGTQALQPQTCHGRVFFPLAHEQDERTYHTCHGPLGTLAGLFKILALQEPSHEVVPY